MKEGMTVSEIIEEVREDMCKNYCRYALENNNRCFEAETKAKDKAELFDMLDAINDEMYEAHCKDCPLSRL